MLITLDWLKEKEACAESLLAFEHKFPNGAEYQEVLDALAAEDRYDWGSWLLRVGGNTNAILEVDELITKTSIFFAGKIIVKGTLKTTKWLLSSGSIVTDGDIKAGEDIKAGGDIEAGWDIEAGEDIKAGRNIKAGWSIVAGWGIEAGRGIEAGEDFGIYAGLKIRISLKSQYAIVRAKTEPKNLLLGTFEKIEEKDQKESGE